MAKKIFALIIIIGVVLFILVSILVQCNEKKTPPSPDEAPYSATTASRVYYTSKLERISSNLTILHGYWWLDNKVWRYDKGDLLLTPKYGKVNITRRSK